MSEYLFGQGKVYIGRRTAAGKPSRLRWVGDCDEFRLSLSSEKREIKESYSGQRLTGASVNVGKTATVSLNLREFTIDNLAIALYGTAVSQGTGEVEGEVLGEAEIGDVLPFAKANVADVLVYDSSEGTPKELTEGTHYILNRRHGSIEIKALPVGVTMPLKVDYSYGNAKSVAAFAQPTPDRFVLFEGINLATEESVVIEVYRVRFNPLQELSAIGDDFGAMMLEGDALIDSTKSIDSELGQFARIIKVAEEEAIDDSEGDGQIEG